MPPLRRCLLFFLLLLLIPPPTRAGIVDAHGEDLQVALITYGTGDEVWERFGHGAIELTDRRDGQAIDFNYGVFDFAEADFFLNFARGRLHYMMDAASSADDTASYEAAGRSITRQVLRLSPEQATRLRDFLLWNLAPAHRHYDYDYYLDNCSTRLRDALDRVLDGELKNTFRQQHAAMTFRQQTIRLMSDRPWLMLGIDAGLGPFADQPLNDWQASFLPDVLMQTMRNVKVQGRRLLTSETVISPNRLQAPPQTPADLRIPLASTGIVLAALLILGQHHCPWLFQGLATLWLALAGLLGLLLVLLWACTAHHAAWCNANLLLLNPLAWLLLAALWRRRSMPTTRYVWLIQLIALLLAPLLHVLPGIVQQNQPWLLLAMPIWLALAWCWRRQMGAR